MYLKIKYSFLFALVILLTTCSSRSKLGDEAVTEPIELRYASYLKMSKGDGFIVAKIINPWDSTKVLHTYILTDGVKPLPAIAGTVVRVPLKRSIVYSSVHGSLIAQLGKLDAIKGVCDLSYILHKGILEACKEGVIEDIGSSMNPNIETMIEMQPDAVLLSPYDDSGGYGRINRLDVPIIECADYMETSPLGRAEWMKFYALLYGADKMGDELFSQIEKRYLSLASLTSQTQEHPEVFCEMMNGAIWYVPGGESTKGVLLRDAGARYVFAHEQKSGSLALSFEKVFDQAAEADFWFVNYNKAEGDMSYSDLLTHNSRYAQFKAVREKRVYGCNTSKTTYYEECPFNPDRLLHNYIQILHPTLLDDEELQFFTPLKE